MAKLPTVEDVAKVAGVSRQTVSNVLNSPGIVREATRKRVQDAIAELKYRPSAAARQLRTRRSSAIGVHLDPYIGGISGVLLDRFVHALTERAGERGMRLCVYSARTAEEELQRLEELIDQGEIDAAVITGTFYGDPRTGWLTQRNLPFVSFGRPWGGEDVFQSAHSWVDVDGATGTAAATRYALDNAGLSVGWFGLHPDQGTGDDRRRGWETTMAETGAFGPRLDAVDDVVAARQLISAALGENGVFGGVDALVCASDSLAVGAHLAASDAGRRDLMVIGFDNTPVAEALGLPSIEQSPELIATATLDLLMGPTGSVVTQHDPAVGIEHVLIAPHLVVREPALHR